MKEKTPYKNALRSKKLIKQAYIKLLTQKEINKITITDIVNTAEINRGTFYAHFIEPNAVLISLESEILTSIKNLLESFKNNIINIRETLDCFSDYLLANSEFLKVIISSKEGPRFKNKIKKVFFETLISDNKKEANQNKVLVSFFCGGLISIYQDYLNNRFEGTIGDLSAQVCKYSEIMHQIGY